MSFAKFVDDNLEKCVLCKLFRQNRNLESSIDSVLDNGKPPRYARLISMFIEKETGQVFTASYVQKHYSRHKENA
jgi:hypothetical protein